MQGGVLLERRGRPKTWEDAFTSWNKVLGVLGRDEDTEVASLATSGWWWDSPVSWDARGAWPGDGSFAARDAWPVLYGMGQFPVSAPRTLRAAVTKGQHSAAETG
jgi:hypothetical protein